MLLLLLFPCCYCCYYSVIVVVIVVIIVAILLLYIVVVIHAVIVVVVIIATRMLNNCPFDNRSSIWQLFEKQLSHVRKPAPQVVCTCNVYLYRHFEENCARKADKGSRGEIYCCNKQQQLSYM